MINIEISTLYYFVFFDTECSVLRNVFIFRHQTFGVEKCLHFCTSDVWWPEIFAFLDTICLVSRNVWILGQWMLGVEKYLHFWTPNVWCQEMFAFLDTQCLVSRNVCIYLSMIRNAYRGINCMQKLHAIFRIWEKKCFGK